MRLVTGGFQIDRSRPRRQDVLSLRHALKRINGICRECRNEMSFAQLSRRPQAMLCRACIEARIECLSADAL